MFRIRLLLVFKLTWLLQRPTSWRDLDLLDQHSFFIFFGFIFWYKKPHPLIVTSTFGYFFKNKFFIVVRSFLIRIHLRNICIVMFVWITCSCAIDNHRCYSKLPCSCYLLFVQCNSNLLNLLNFFLDYLLHYFRHSSSASSTLKSYSP